MDLQEKEKAYLIQIEEKDLFCKAVIEEKDVLVSNQQKFHMMKLFDNKLKALKFDSKIDKNDEVVFYLSE